MSSFFRGVITGWVMVIVLVLSIGSKKRIGKGFSDTYRHRLIKLEERIGMVEGSVNKRFIIVGENFFTFKK